VSRRALFREVNAKICEIDATFGTAGPVYHVLCECGRPECYERFEVPASLYDGVRTSANRFAVASGHHREDAIVSSGLGFDVVDASAAARRAPAPQATAPLAALPDA
jgi:hypothetical protein